MDASQTWSRKRVIDLRLPLTPLGYESDMEGFVRVYSCMVPTYEFLTLGIIAG